MISDNVEFLPPIFNKTELHETWWSYRYMFLVDPKVFRFVVMGVKAIFLGFKEGGGYYRILVEFLPPIFMPCFGSHFENGRHLENFENAELLL
jgi:hypothetical protein